ncbi:HigA family addiction module antidote protein [Bradyrhizobium sp. WSM 1791]|uniref:HigA family addiction module antidote protein n=2 Tax=Bradyrhizobium australiense TaxID=2721161 RepID=A0A7Y4GRA2_9BRAD|nr:HigA family addiction module antidote protein [Bradyrhizobium australiense]
MGQADIAAASATSQKVKSRSRLKQQLCRLRAKCAIPPIHHGGILREEFLVPLKLTSYAVAAAVDVPRTRIERIAREEKPLRPTPRCSSASSKAGAAFWTNIQAGYDLETAEDTLAPQIKKIASYKAA